MFERFTDRARRVIVLAQEEARTLQHLPGMRSEGNVAVRRGIPLTDHLFDLFAGVIQGHTL